MTEHVGTDYVFVPTEVVSNYVGNLIGLDKKSDTKVDSVSDSKSDPERRGFFGRIKNRSKILAKGVLNKVTGRKGDKEGA